MATACDIVVAMFNWFKSNYTKSLERRITELQQDFTLRLREINNAHAAELTYVKNELQWHKDESERLRRFLMPNMQPAYDQVAAAHEPAATGTKNQEPEFHGTPFQRMVAADLKAQDAEIERQKLLKAQKAGESKPV